MLINHKGQTAKDETTGNRHVGKLRRKENGREHEERNKGNG
jgi:hypothetical protein